MPGAPVANCAGRAPGPGARATELAALALANLAAEVTSRRAIRLSGGVPPLARLLTLRPCVQARPHAGPCCAPSVTALFGQPGHVQRSECSSMRRARLCIASAMWRSAPGSNWFQLGAGQVLARVVSSLVHPHRL